MKTKNKIKDLGCCSDVAKVDFEALKKKYKNRLRVLRIHDEDAKIFAVGLWDVLGYEEIKLLP